MSIGYFITQIAHTCCDGCKTKQHQNPAHSKHFVLLFVLLYIIIHICPLYNCS